MSHLDELDEFEAGSSSAEEGVPSVSALFRYCVLAGRDVPLQHARPALRPTASYPFFHLRMEDVQVWDKNRPTRMIPRAEVYTSSDVTVEELPAKGSRS